MKITVFTPTFNRVKLISRVFDSLCRQSYENFEWVIIDDGSTDGTAEVIEEFGARSKFPIIYSWRENQGKTKCINEALSLASGEFFLVFDSDDWCTNDALQRFVETWSELGEERTNYCAISALKKLANGEIVGEDYSRMRKFGDSYVDRFNRRIIGDKWEFIKTDIHRECLYDVEAGEKYLAPEYSWLKMGKSHKTIFLNEALGVVEYQPDGISMNNIQHRMRSPKSAYGFYRLGQACAEGPMVRFRMKANSARFALHARRADLMVNLGATGIIAGTAFYAWDIVKKHVSQKISVK